MYNSIYEAVFNHSENLADKLAIADSITSYTYKNLIQKVVATATKLEKFDISKGSFVLVECSQDCNFLIIDLACNLIGAVFVPIEKNAFIERVKDIYVSTEAECIICTTDYSSVGKTISFSDCIGDESNNIYDLPDSRTVAEVLFTTGTTGTPKGIMISNFANVAIAENIIYGTKMGENAVEIVPMPLSHSHGLRTCYSSLLNGGTVVIIDGVMNVASFFELIDKYHVNALDLSPTLAKILMKVAKRGLKKNQDAIDYIEIGTAVLDEETKTGIKEIFPNSRIYNFYGSTEAGRSCSLDINQEDFPYCIGYPSKNAKFVIVDDNHQPFKSSAENPGLIAVSGSMMMSGYFKSEELTAKTVVDGILYTSDLGYIDEDGKIYVLGRADDIINYKGIKVAPDEIESVAIQYSGIKDCCCVPEKDATCGQVPKLYVVISSDTFDMNEYTAFLKSKLEQSRVPKYVEIIDTIPRASNGKLQRKKLMK